ncbi:MAG: hypothetical protein GOMPHAMPRED_000563 [Gomphillus americanus]|uniref:Ureidoglycolate hydrolase n=1 Tax=Gomphillus americanus TaxID=1940652 RepID=A0A8H3I1N7_9LECA|nr:MAG: hypothetical protein GOMPHAMPRED_000563 [Gomphillus americanus]
MSNPGFITAKPPWLTQTQGRTIFHPLPYTITAEPLTPLSFSPFGSVIEDPEYPHIPLRTKSLQDPISANQGTARKYTHVSPIINQYDSAPSQQPATVQMSYFACEPRDLDIVTPRRDPFYGDERTPDSTVPHGLFKIEVLERHAFTTQTFAPMGLADSVTPGLERGWPPERDLGTGYLVIVAPTTRTEKGEEVPEVNRLRAFLAHGRQAVTYGVGVWHAPMVVVGKDVVGFVVTQWANGVANEDCQEMYLETQPLHGDEVVGVLVKGFEGHHRREET